MNVYQLLDISQRAFETMFLTALPFLLAAIVVGVLIGLFQAITQLQDQAISFVPKVVVMITVLFFAGNWVLGNMGKVMKDVFLHLAEVR